MQTQHAAVWLDHREAKIFFFDRDHAQELRLSASNPVDQVHKHAGTREGGRIEMDVALMNHIVKALEPVAEWLITGPGSAKDELAKHVRTHHHTLASRIVGVEKADHPTDGQIVALARKFFRAADRMQPLTSAK
jgi:stalled ribosome rescue protein Dom34